jgi:hypothetical protein
MILLIGVIGELLFSHDSGNESKRFPDLINDKNHRIIEEFVNQINGENKGNNHIDKPIFLINYKKSCINRAYTTGGCLTSSTLVSTMSL